MPPLAPQALSRGGLWAVQAKAYDPEYSVTKADVDTFLSESSRPEFSYRLLIATTNRVGSTARRTLAAQEKQAGLLLLADLEAARVNWPVDALRPPLRREGVERLRREAVEADKERVVGKSCAEGDLKLPRRADSIEQTLMPPLVAPPN